MLDFPYCCKNFTQYCIDYLYCGIENKDFSMRPVCFESSLSPDVGQH